MTLYEWLATDEAADELSELIRIANGDNAAYLGRIECKSILAQLRKMQPYPDSTARQRAYEAGEIS